MTLTDMNTKTKRAFATHKPMWQRFQTELIQPSTKTSETQSNVYQRQYSHVYAQRLAMLKPRCWESVPDDVPRVSRVLDLHENTPCVLVGTLVKECESPSEDPIHPDSECRASDVLYLEDESGRVTLSTEELHQWCTGVVVAVQGIVKDGGVFHVDKFYTPAAGPCPTIEGGELKPPSHDDSLAPYVMLISGLHSGDPNVCSLTRDMLVGYLEGQLGPNASKICRVIVAGNSATSSTYGVQEMDGWVAQICATGTPVDLIPGNQDPTTANWPQRPLHTSLLKYSGSFVDKELLSRTPNPFACGLGDKYVIGTDGRNVADLQKHLATPDAKFTAMEALRETLRWRHLCPTGPSSVPTVPQGETDPMVMTETPQLYFAGNCESFDMDLVEEGDVKTRLVCVPKFSETGAVVIVNLETLDCELLCFDDRE